MNIYIYFFSSLRKFYWKRNLKRSIIRYNWREFFKTEFFTRVLVRTIDP